LISLSKFRNLNVWILRVSFNKKSLIYRWFFESFWSYVCIHDHFVIYSVVTHFLIPIKKKGVLDNLSALKTLKIYYCRKLESLPEEGLRNLNSLEVLEIRGCPRLNSLPMDGLCGLSSLRKLSVKCCDKFTSLSEGVRHLTALEYLELGFCPELNSLPGSIQHLTSLQYLFIFCCPNLKKRWEKDLGEDWPKIAHIPDITII